MLFLVFILKGCNNAMKFANPEQVKESIFAAENIMNDIFNEFDIEEGKLILYEVAVDNMIDYGM